MIAATRIRADAIRHTTMLELVQQATWQTESEEAAVDSVLDLLRTGRARLTGNFRGTPIDLLERDARSGSRTVPAGA